MHSLDQIIKMNTPAEVKKAQALAKLLNRRRNGDAGL